MQKLVLNASGVYGSAMVSFMENANENFFCYMIFVGIWSALQHWIWHCDDIFWLLFHQLYHDGRQQQTELDQHERHLEQTKRRFEKEWKECERAQAYFEKLDADGNFTKADVEKVIDMVNFVNKFCCKRYVIAICFSLMLRQHVCLLVNDKMVRNDILKARQKITE